MTPPQVVLGRVLVPTRAGGPAAGRGRRAGAAAIRRGQITTAILLDHAGVLGLRQRRLNRARLAAVLLAFAALALRLWGTR